MEFTYKNSTKILFGKSMCIQLKEEITEKNILLVAGKGSIKKNGIYDQIKDIPTVELWDVQANPLLSKVQEGIKLVKEHKIDAILAVGGGSVIDTAKVIAAGAFVDDVWNMFETQDISQAMPIYVVLTLSATGTEMNGNAVITHDEKKLKWAIRSPLLYPKVSVIDPSMQESLPWVQTSNGAIDALSHCMETYFTFTDQELSMKVNESIMRTIIESTNALQKNEKDMHAREQLAWCATMALNGMSGIGTIGDWASHAIEHGISALYPNVAHAQGLAVVFPAWIEFMQKENPTQFRRWAKKVWDKDSVLEAIQAMKEQFKAWKAPISLQELSIPQDAIPNIVGKTMLSGKLGRVKELTKEDIKSILNIAW